MTAVTIAAYGNQIDKPIGAATGPDGRFTLRVPEQGDFGIRVSHAAYATSTIENANG